MPLGLDDPVCGSAWRGEVGEPERAQTVLLAQVHGHAVAEQLAPPARPQLQPSRTQTHDQIRRRVL
jgi:hypothetical protein